jgi:hypothetical protein
MFRRFLPSDLFGALPPWPDAALSAGDYGRGDRSGFATGGTASCNIALAIAAAEELTKFGSKVTPKQIEQGIRETHWPGDSRCCRRRPRRINMKWSGRGAQSQAGSAFGIVGNVCRTRTAAGVCGLARQGPRDADVLFPIASRWCSESKPRAATTANWCRRDLAQARRSTRRRRWRRLAKAREVRSDGVIVVTGQFFWWVRRWLKWVFRRRRNNSDSWAGEIVITNGVRDC